MAPQYQLYDRQGNLVEKRPNPYGAGDDARPHHDNPRLIADLLPECGVFIARRMGGGSKRKLVADLGIRPYTTEETVPQAALAEYLRSREKLQGDYETMNNSWQAKKDSFEIVDVRELRGNFLPMIQKKAASMPVGQGLRVIQSFEPVPLYTVLGEIGFEHESEQVSDDEYHVYFYRAAAPATEVPTAPPLQPLGILKFKQVDPFIADQLIKVWERIYKRDDAAIDQKTLYLIAFSVGVGAGRMPQATRELIKAYAAGATVKELDEVFALLIWLEGASTFVSEISTSPAFGAYELIKRMAGQGKERKETLAAVIEKYSERHPEVGIFASS
jgi:alkylhydroperoxidase/carboxymuconolactone decarboxylase family protein YurZ